MSPNGQHGHYPHRREPTPTILCPGHVTGSLSPPWLAGSTRIIMSTSESSGLLKNDAKASDIRRLLWWKPDLPTRCLSCFLLHQYLVLLRLDCRSQSRCFTSNAPPTFCSRNYLRYHMPFTTSPQSSTFLCTSVFAAIIAVALERERLPGKGGLPAWRR